MQPPIGPDSNKQYHTGSGPMPPVQQPGAYQPGNTGPFYDDTGYAPELRAERSENLYRKDEKFWEHVPDMEQTLHGRPHNSEYFNHPEQFHQTRRSKPRPRRGSYVIALVLCVAVLLMAVTVVFASPLFAIREIRVVGNSKVSTDEIIRRSGITTGMNRFSLDTDAVTRRVEGNCYLICELVHMPERNTVEIRVSERQVTAIIDYNGLLYYADSYGMILEEFANRNIPMNGKVLVTGMSIRHCDVGQTIVLADSSQLDVYDEIFKELKVMGALDRISELNMSSVESIFLTTRDGYSVRLGNGSDIHRKLRAMILTLESIEVNGLGVGDIDVSSPVNPSFYPEKDQQTEENGTAAAKKSSKNAGKFAFRLENACIPGQKRL